MLNDTIFELKDFSRFFHDFFRESMKMQVLSIPIKSTLFELKTHKKNGGGSGDRTHDLLFRREPLYPTELCHRARIFAGKPTAPK